MGGRFAPRGFDPAQETLLSPTNRPEVRVYEPGRSHLWLFLLLAAIVTLLLGLPLPLTDGVTAFYGTIAKNILATGDWLTLHHRMMPLVDKPPLTFWLMSLSFAAFGTSEWALRLWHLGLAVGVALGTYALARLDLPRHLALAAAAILMTELHEGWSKDRIFPVVWQWSRSADSYSMGCPQPRHKPF